jgi:hypothetical protein
MIEYLIREDNLIRNFEKFFKWVTEKEPTEEEKGLIAEWVVVTTKFKELKGGLKDESKI